MSDRMASQDSRRSRRFPLWTTLIPLVAGIAVWAFIWRGYAADFEADLQSVLPPDTAIEAGGFPYRLEARLGTMKLEQQDAALELALAVEEASVNRVPWQRDRQVISLGASQARAALGPITGADFVIDAPAAQASLRLDGKRIARLSAVWQQPAIRTGLFEAPLKASQFEAHLRETPATGAAADGRSPLPTQVQLVLSGTDLRIAEGAPLAFGLTGDLTAPGPITSLATWQQGGTGEIRSAVLSDATGEVARLSATVSADGARLRVAGTVETVCPASVRAAIAGAPAPAEQRSRKPERIAISGTLPGGLEAAPRDPGKPPPPVRAQEPPCPRMR
jgi:hypothetical protein